MTSCWTPAAERHRLLPQERAVFEAAKSDGARLVPAWIAFGPADQSLLLGPGLTVAGSTQNAGLALFEGDAARDLLLAHAFRRDPDLCRRADCCAPGTPIAEVTAALAAAFPDWICCAWSPQGAMFVKLPHAILSCDGKYGELDGIGWHEGARAIDLVFQYGLSRPLR